MAEIHSSATAMSGQEDTISQLKGDRDLEEAEFTYYSKRLEESQADESLGDSSISEVEMPTPAARSLNKLYKTVAGIFFAGMAFAFGLPFVIELVLDRSLKHPTQVQTALGLPFFISIPAMNGNGKAHSLKGAKKAAALLAGKTGEKSPPAAGEPLPVAPANGHVALWDSTHSLQPFYETLRDRLMTYFEMINLTHKPKLVAVTSCGGGAGVTSTAAGLASSLSETGDGNVLLVDMNVRDGEAHHFYKGKLACGLDEVLEKGTREGALVQGNLYVARELENDDKLPRILPKRFSHLLPKMKASDFDYIIFDMPPVSQISITPRLARFMDMVLLVVESEKTDRDVAKRVAAMLSESKTNVGVVLNKNRSYLPQRLHQEV
jgi:Mrp family chromosome partitioning ATPase